MEIRQILFKIQNMNLNRDKATIFASFAISRDRKQDDIVQHNDKMPWFKVSHALSTVEKKEKKIRKKRISPISVNDLCR